MISLLEYFINPDIEKNSYFEEGVLQRYFTGKDEETLKKFEKAAKAKTFTAEEKEKLLKEIDEALDNATRIVTSSTVAHWFVDYAGIALLGGIPLIIRIFTKIINDDDRAAYRELLHRIRAIVASAKVKN